ncbi:AzlC family ABC transporter permease [Roseovarius sp. SCSIO 43702]|uniref:AzlC family ABC transporter permease n=1 Tax=Roseovarius sp. SCSIO 43702 TaxID=2823043 RepID=UPI001C72BA79|nr:AzlC family ABC transporter permease [Roseovarius sp. SCSIO 43702]QYX55824.1 AzlC family ABC transporter permease [Roseovarius sp. SCSIO 43702]
MENTKSPYWQGVRAGLPFIVILAPFGVLFGVVATEAGLNLFEAVTMSALTIAGASQFTAIQLLQDGVPTLIVIAAALTVNLRLAMYSASLVPHLGQASLPMRALVAYCLVDQNAAGGAAVFEAHPHWTLRQRLAFYFGMSSPLIPNWIVFTVVGALVGERIPEALALDFAIPITFIALVAPMLRTGAHRVAAISAIAASLMLTWMPYSLGIIAAGAVGMVVGAEVERRTEGWA